MLDLKFIREYPEVVRVAIGQKRIQLDLDALLALDSQVLQLKQETETLQAERNSNAKLVPKASPDERPAFIQRGKDLGEVLKTNEGRLRELQDELQQLLLKVPQIPLAGVPVGLSDEDNVELYRKGTLPSFGFNPRNHIELCDLRGWAEFERVGKIAGSRSYMLRGELALLEMALINFGLQFLAERGFTPLTASALVRPETLTATGHFPGGEDQVYRIQDDALMLAGTAEVPVNFLHSGEILDGAQLPIRYAAFSSAFRSEAGSAGRDVRGLMRVHEFKKVEQYIICAGQAAESSAWFEHILANAEDLLTALELPYRVIQNCTGDMGAGKAFMYDIECWVPSEQQYRETHSCSNLQDWQARRTGLRYRDSEGKVQFAHTLNNTGLATPRLLVPFLEVHQQADGRVRIPSALQPFLGGKAFI